MKLVIQGLGVFLLVGALTFGLSRATQSSHADMVYGAVVRHLDQENRMSLPKASKSQMESRQIYFLQVEGKDPTPGLTNLLNGKLIEARGYSHCIEGANSGKGNPTRDKTTGETGKVMKLQNITWPRADQPVVHAGSDIYVLRREGDGWKVDFHGKANG